MNLIDLCGPGALEREFYDKIIQNVESTFPNRFDFVVCSDAPGEPFKEIPHTHPPKIVFSFSDELNRLPPYLNREDTFCVFKVYPPNQKHLKVIPIPLPCNRGFSGTADRKIKDRHIDIFFHGQIFNWHRQIMYKNLEIFKFNNPNINFQLGHSKCFNTGLSLAEYSETLSNTKIAICPGGNNLETFRFTEAAKCGCVMVGPPKLNYWFYDQNPQINIEKWEDIHGLLPRVLGDLDKCQEISENTKQYYSHRFSEDAVTDYILSVIKAKLA